MTEPHRKVLQAEQKTSMTSLANMRLPFAPINTWRPKGTSLPKGKQLASPPPTSHLDFAFICISEEPDHC